jgi:hypothetical protein
MLSKVNYQHSRRLEFIASFVSGNTSLDSHGGETG